MRISAVRVPSAALLDLVARAEAEPESDEAYFLVQLRAAIAGLEGGGEPFTIEPRAPRPDRLVARSHGVTPA